MQMAASLTLKLSAPKVMKINKGIHMCMDNGAATVLHVFARGCMAAACLTSTC